MKLIFNYFKTFNKVILSEKIPFINFENLVSSTWSVSQLLNQTVNYVGYIIVSVAINGVGMQLISFRESGFLKTYTMISGGNKKYGVIGLVLSEMLFGYLSVFIFGFVIGLFYLKNLLKLLLNWETLFLVPFLENLRLFQYHIKIFPLSSHKHVLMSNYHKNASNRLHRAM